MKKRILTLCVAILTILAFTLGACAEGAFDGLEGVVILTPDEEQAANAAPAVGEQSGLVLTLGDSSVKKAGDTYADITFDVNLMNWDMESYELNDAVSATLYYEDAYPFPGEFDFGKDVEIGMLVEEAGKLAFSVPQIVALADIEALRLELTVLEDTYVEELTPFELPDEMKKTELPFDYGTRESDALELKLGDARIRQSYNGDSDEKYKWITQSFSVVNWSSEVVDFEDAISMLLTYAGQYGFQGEIEYPQEAIDPLEVVQCQAVFHVPNIVTEAEAGALALRIALNGEETEQDYDLGESTARTSCLDQYEEGYNYWNGRGVERNEAKAQELFKQVFKELKRDHDDPEGERQRVLGRLYAEGWGTEKDLNRARELYEEAVALGNADALTDLGNLYFDGLGVEQDYTRARELFEEAMALGNARAIARLGYMYATGDGIEVDYARALELLPVAAEQGDPNAMTNLGNMYLYGVGVEQDYARALELLTEAAEQGITNAMANLGNMYLYGEGVEQDYARALELYTAAAEQGDPTGLKNLGNLYENGYGVEKDEAKAQEYYAASEKAEGNQ